MAGGLAAPPLPSLEEHEAHRSEVRRQVEELRRLNAKQERQQRELLRAAAGHQKAADGCARGLSDLQDRGAFVRAAAAAAKSCEGGRDPPPYHFYQDQMDKVRDVSVSMLAGEAEDFAKSKGLAFAGVAVQRKPQPTRRMVRSVPANFSPFQA
eukprot:SRR837773.20893.p3 GENE.SRR837773.20893~~SRR837773.20893.p3  ORF type:complete len:160 (+),score=71.97 SRR837773.20893:22-480(+)